MSSPRKISRECSEIDIFTWTELMLVLFMLRGVLYVNLIAGINQTRQVRAQGISHRFFPLKMIKRHSISFLTFCFSILVQPSEEGLCFYNLFRS